ncbi:MAG TPA: 3D domain-containing protein [Bacilli bacterium]|nr:3D domain-containing protein [Bacilli bacterium]
MRKVNRKSVFGLSAAAAVLLLAGSTTAASAYKTITLDVDGKTETLEGFQFGTVGELLKERGIEVGEKDLVQPAATSALQEGTTIQVQHALAITIQDGANKSLALLTQAHTVADVLQAQKIQLHEADQVNLDPQSSLKSGDQIVITRRTEKVEEREEAIPFQTERQPDANLYTGTEKVLTSGVEGKATIKTTVFFENGKEVDRKQDRQVAQQPVNQVVAYGTKTRPIVVASRSGANFTASREINMSASAYSMPGERTATGTITGHGTVAVDPSVIPLGTKLYIEGYGYGVACDVGGAIKGNRIDLHFDTRQQALQFGRRTVKVYILK